MNAFSQGTGANNGLLEALPMDQIKTALDLIHREKRTMLEVSDSILTRSSTTVGPIPARSRILVLDVLRGCAVLGILLVNIQSFAMVSEARWNPAAYPNMTSLELAIWTFTHVFAEEKFISLLAFVFGAGILLMTERIQRTSPRPAGWNYYRRTAGLLLIGLAHAYLLWGGDVLVSYAICGICAYAFRGLRPRSLLTLAAALIAAGQIVVAGQFIFPYLTSSLPAFMHALPASAESAAYSGSWLMQMRARAPMAIQTETLVLASYTFWRVTALMLAGLAFAKLGIFRGSSKTAAYLWVAVLGGLIGLPLAYAGTILHRLFGWQSFTGYSLELECNYWASLLVAGCYGASIVLIVHGGMLRVPCRWVAAAGRTALSNYLLQTLICTFVFYGHGLGFFGRLDRAEQLAIVVSIWAGEVLLSILWLRAFRFGPAEWALRAFTYGRLTFD